MNKVSHIPISWYFDEKIHQKEHSYIFANSPQYIGHTAMVPNVNDYFVLEGNKEGYILFHHDDQYAIVSNQCRHHQATLLRGSGNTKRIICPIHKWVYDAKGNLLQASRFLENPSLNLSREKLFNSQGLLHIEEHSSYKTMHDDILERLRWENYSFHSRQKQHYDFNWKLFMEVYLDNYHIPAIHPGLRKLIHIQEQRWLLDKSYSAQFVKLTANLNQSGTKNYHKYQQVIQNYIQSSKLDKEIMWLAIYPNIMIESYPFMNIVSTVYSHKPDSCVNYVDYFFDKDIISKYPDFPQIAMTAYNETAIEDAKACNLIQDGKKTLYTQGHDEAGPYHPEMEMGLPSFYAYLLEKM
jgi:choline monooxygenase